MPIMWISDQKQSLYLWRASVPHVVENIQKLLPDVQPGHILKNYRSPAQLVNLANYYSEVFRGTFAVDYSEPHLSPMQDCFSSIHFDTPSQEMAHVARDILRYKASGVEWDKFAILVRSNNQLEEVEGALINMGIPYRVRYDSNSKLNSSSFKFLISLYTVVLNPNDMEAFGEVLGVVKGIGGKFVEEITATYEQQARGRTLPLMEVMLRKSFGRDTKQYQTLKRFLEQVMLPLWNQFERDPSFLHFNAKAGLLFGDKFKFEGEEGFKADCFFVDLDGSKFRDAMKMFDNMYQMSGDSESVRRMTDRERFEQIYSRVQASQERYSEDHAKLKGGQQPAEVKRVLLSTVHSFKGMQSDYVYLCQVRNLHPVNIEDVGEMCCFYVAVTRAKRKFTVTSSNSVKTYTGQLMKANPHPFLSLYLKGVERVKRG